MSFKYIASIFFCTVILQAQEYVGIIKPINDVFLSLSLDGKIDDLFVKEGSVVSKSDKLLRVDDSLQQLEMRRSELIWEDKAQLDFSKKSNKIFKSLLDSTRSLYKKTKAVSRDDLQTLEMRYYTQQGDIQARIENEKKEEIEYLMAKEKLSKYTLHSSIDGVVTEVKLKKGEWAKMGEPLVRVVNTDICFLEINIDESYSSTLSIGEALSFNILMNDVIIPIEGNISFISSVADDASSLVRLKIGFDNRKKRITPGVSASVNIVKKVNK